LLDSVPQTLLPHLLVKAAVSSQERRTETRGAAAVSAQARFDGANTPPNPVTAEGRLEITQDLEFQGG
jgi:hypothetical protein